jgi:sarcosine oxidase, subunit alpha
MADIDLTRRSPLQSYVELFGAAGHDRTVRLRELPFLTMTELRGDGLVTKEGDAPSGGGAVLRLGPDWWLHIGSPAPDGGVDVSAQRTTLELAGPRARDVLMTGCPLDLHPSTFVVGTCGQTLLGQAQVVIHRVAPDTYRILVRASFAGYLAKWLLDAMLEHSQED